MSITADSASESSFAWLFWRRVHLGFLSGLNFIFSVCGDILQGNLLRPGTLGGAGKSHPDTFWVYHIRQADAGEPAACVEQWLCSVSGNIKPSSPESYFSVGLRAHPKGKRFLTGRFVGWLCCGVCCWNWEARGMFSLFLAFFFCFLYFGGWFPFKHNNRFCL